MAIAPINNVSFRNNYNQVSFEGKNKEKSHQTSSIKNTLRAIPLATLIAMSPLNSSAQVKTEPTTQEFNQALSEITAGKNIDALTFPSSVHRTISGAEKGNSVLFDDEDANLRDAVISLKSTDNDDSTGEVVTLRVQVPCKGTIGDVKVSYLDAIELRVDTLMIRNTKDVVSGGTYTQYFAIGPSVSAQGNMKALSTGNDIPGLFNKEIDNHDSLLITKDLYDCLASTMGNKVAYKETNRKVDFFGIEVK